MDIWVFGNLDLPEDSLPLKLMPQIQRAFPQIVFRTKDPAEEWDPVPEQLTVIDTVKGLKKVQVFTDLNQFEASPTVTMHDLDLLAELRFLQKLGKLKKITLYGVPHTLSPEAAFTQLEALLRQCSI
jgi:hypothetical protein